MSRNLVIRQYAAAYDRLAEDEQIAVARGEYDRAQEAHELAMVVLRAYRAEMDDPEPRDTCACASCVLVRSFRRVA